MSEKSDCGHCDGDGARRLLFRLALACFISLVVLVLVVWLVLRPTRPRFYLQDDSVVQLNLTPGSGLVTSVLQVTLSSRNPNDRIGIYYDRLVAYTRYRGQQTTAAEALPAGYQGHNDVTVWSPYLFGGAVPLAADLAAALSQDQQAGFVLLSVHIDGRLRWKVGAWTSGHFHLHVNCPAFLVLDSSRPSDAGSYYYRFQYTRCRVDI
ncbi:NDR1/HIN1-like protein 12 [Curcuma longa]|uniref:NDR1/HIN1-like protein 12 n=1 Tax=Curcuma longa TaxID=136217 RepID=UPI003D9EDFC0